MVEQKLSIASSLQHQSAPNQLARLIAEIGSQHIALLATTNNAIEAFELYEFDSTNDWQTVFAGTATQSKLLGRQYATSTVYLNIPEALIVPAEKFRKESMEPYLTSVYGNAHNSLYDADIVGVATNPACIYRYALTLNEAVKTHFTQPNYKHSYTKVLENLLGNGRMLMEMLKVQFYQKTMLVTVIYGNKLMLMQSYNYNSPEDIIYYLLNIVQEFSLNVQSTPVEVSGMLDISSRHFELLENVFGRLSLETVSTDSIFKEHIGVANAHYYTPFYNLSI